MTNKCPSLILSNKVKSDGIDLKRITAKLSET